jgi:hypothetical protein
MPGVKKAHCPAPDVVVTACRTYAAVTHAQSSAKASAVLISEGIRLLAEARQDAPKLVEACRSKYPRFGQEISTHIPTSMREQARHLKRAHAFASLQDLYLEAILKGLTKHGFLGPSLEPPSVAERGGC